MQCNGRASNCAKTLFFQAPWDVGGGGMMGLINLSDCGRNPPVTKIKGHTGSIQDLAFSPFYESILASGSEGMRRTLNSHLRTTHCRALSRSTFVYGFSHLASSKATTRL